MASLIAGPSPATCHHVKSFQNATCQRQKSSSLSTKAFLHSSEKSVSGSFPSVQFFGQKLSLKTNNGAITSPLSSYTRKGQIKAQVERSYVMIKPDGVQRGLVGEIIARFEKKGFTLKGLKLFQCPKELAQEHYKDLSEKPFYGKLVDYIVSGPVVAMVWEGKGVVLSARKLIGATNPLSSEPGTIRGDFAIQVGRNVIHGSDSPENGEREIALWFDEDEIVEWSPTLTPWLVE